MTVGVGVIGLGAVSGAHLAGLTAAEGAHLAAACDTDPGARGRLTGTPVYESWEDLMADDAVDAVMILLPHALHAPVAEAALQAGKHVCLEKPMAIDTAECDALVALAERRGLTLAVAENARWVAAYAAAHDHLPRLGRIRLVRGFIHGSAVRNYARDDAGWRIEPHGIGAIIDAAPHMLYLLRWFFGDVSSVQATTRHWVRDNVVPAVAVEDGALVSGRLADGGHFSIEVSLSVEIPWGERLEIYGDNGAVVVDQLAPHPVMLFDGPDHAGHPDERVPHDLAGWQPASISAAARDFAEAIAEGRAPLVTGHDGAAVARLIDAAYRSAAEGGIPMLPGNLG